MFYQDYEETRKGSNRDDKRGVMDKFHTSKRDRTRGDRVRSFIKANEVPVQQVNE